MPLVRICAWLLLGSIAFSSCGCLQTLLGAMIAPEGVALSGAQGGANALASLVAPDDYNSMTDSAATAADLDRIIAAHPDSTNVGELEALRDELRAKSSGAQHHARDGSAATEPDRLAEHDRRVIVPADFRAPDDALVLESRPPRRRGPPRGPEAFPEPTALDPWRPQWYLMETEPVRLR